MISVFATNIRSSRRGLSGRGSRGREFLERENGRIVA